jgi:hypothetical protein
MVTRHLAPSVRRKSDAQGGEAAGLYASCSILTQTLPVSPLKDLQSSFVQWAR